ncbi:MAG: bifunctional lysylphosphatidylglycerol flippase/synthetase MprF [Novosphingobium sp.]
MTTLVELRSRVASHHRVLTLALTAAVAVAGCVALRTLLGEVSGAAIVSAFARLSPLSLTAAVGLTGASYLLLTLFDVAALRMIGRPLPWPTAAVASFTSYALSHNLGLGLLTGGSARLRVYRSAGLSVGEVGSVIALAGASFWYGILLVIGVGLMLHAGPFGIAGHVLGPAVLRLAGGAALALLAVPLLLARSGRCRRIDLAGWAMPLPGIGLGLGLAAISATDLAIACGALFVLIPHAAPALFPLLLLAYALAAVAALVSHVPGGLGVFEAVILALVPGDKPALMAALLAYRVFYYLMPLGLALAILAHRESGRWSRRIAPSLRLLRGMTPVAASVLAFLGGIILLVSGALPAVPARLHFVHHLLPLPFAEASHIAASLSGTLLLFLAPGLWRRLDGAFHATQAVLLAGMAFSLMKGLDYEEAAALGVIAVVLQAGRGAFYRRTALLAEPMSPRWIVAALGAVASSVVVGVLAYGDAATQDAVWWQFAAHGDAARFVRATFAIALGLTGFALWRLLGPARSPGPDPLLDPATFAAAFQHSDRVDALLALTGDKQFLVAPEGDAFLMYRVVGGTWIVMGDPVGHRGRWADLLWTLRHRADAAQGRLFLYQITPASVPLAIDLGLELAKYGEEARVDLAAFSRGGRAAKDLRHAERRALGEGASFAVLAPDAVRAHVAELRAVSDDWLRHRRAGEKGFSLGRFDPDYVARFACAVVRSHGRIVAFATILATPNREELSIDLMRHGAVLPYGTMDFLFLSLIEWGQAHGYRWFNLGIAPLAGIDARRMAPLWAHAGRFVFRHGEARYGFRGLRAYKAKFASHWEPRYVASERGLMLARGIAAVLRLVSTADVPGKGEPQRALAA